MQTQLKFKVLPNPGSCSDGRNGGWKESDRESSPTKSGSALAHLWDYSIILLFSVKSKEQLYACDTHLDVGVKSREWGADQTPPSTLARC